MTLADVLGAEPLGRGSEVRSSDAIVAVGVAAPVLLKDEGASK
jgi:hypothetical protein